MTEQVLVYLNDLSPPFDNFLQKNAVFGTSVKNIMLLVGPSPVLFVTMYPYTSILLRVLIFFVRVSGKGQI